MSTLREFLESISANYSSLDLSSEDLNKLEYFVLFSSKSELQPQIGNLISILFDYFQKEIEDSSFDPVRVVSVFKIFRFFRTQCLNNDQITQLENFAVQALQKDSHILQIQAFSLMIESIAKFPRTNFSTYNEFFNWVLRYVQSYEDGEPDVMILILSNIVYVTYFHKINNLPVIDLIQILIQKAKELLNRQVEIERFRTNELIIRKIFGALSKIFTSIQELPREVVPDILEFEQKIPNTVQYSLIFQSFVPLISIVASECLQKNYGFNMEISQIIQNEFLMNLPYLTFLPHAKNKKIQLATTRFIAYTLKHSNTHNDMLPLIWPLIYAVYTQANSTQLIYGFIQNIIKENADMHIPNFLPSVLQQVIGCLNILQQDLLLVDRESKSKSFEYDSWITTIFCCVKLFPFIISCDDINKIEIQFLEAYHELTKFIAFLLDLYTAQGAQNYPDIEYSQEFLQQINRSDFAKRSMPIIREYLKIIQLLPNNFKSAILNQNIILLLPTKSYHTMHKSILQHLIKNISDPIMFHVAFFRLVSHKFEELFLPNPLMLLLDLTRAIFQDAFGTDAKASTFSNAPPSMGEDISSFIWKILASKNAVLIELLLTIFVLFFPTSKAPRVPVFLRQLKESPNLMILLLNTLSEEPNLKVFTGLLALYFYPICSTNYEQADQWTNLFLPALESDNHLYAVHLLFTGTSKIFPMWVKKLNKATQLRLVTVLTASLAKQKPNDRCYPLTLLSRIPEITTGLSMTLHDTKKRKTKIEIDGFPVYAENVYDAIKKNDDFDLTTVKKIFLQLVRKLELIELCSSSIFSDFSQLLVKKNEIANAINEIDDVNMDKKIFLKGYFMKEFDSENISSPKEFLGTICMLGNNKNYSKTVIRFCSDLLPKVPLCPMTVNISVGLLHCSTYHFDDVLEVFRTKLFTLDWNTNDDKIVARMMWQRLQASLTSQNKSYRRLLIEIFKFFEQKQLNVYPTASNITNAFEQIGKKVNNHNERFDFLMKNFGDITNPAMIVDTFIQGFQELKVDTIPEEVYDTVKNHYFFGIQSGKFSIRVIASLLSYCPADDRTTMQFIQFINILKTPKFNKYIPYFLSKVKKNKVHSLPLVIDAYVKLIDGMPEIPAHYPDVLLLEFAVSLPNFLHCKEVYNWCVMCAHYKPNDGKILTPQMLNTFERVMNVVKILKDKGTNVDLFVSNMMSLLAFTKFTTLENVIKLEKVVQMFQEEIPKVIAVSLSAKWDIKMFYIFVDMLCLKGMDNFRNNSMLLLLENSNKVFNFIKSNNDFSFASYVYSYLLIKFSEQVKNYDDTDFSLVARSLIMFISSQQIKFEPCLFIAFAQLLFPIDHAQKYTSSSNLLNFFTSEVIPFIRSRSDLFFQPLIMRLLTVFCKKLPEDSRPNVFSSLTTFPDFNTEVDRAFCLALADVACAVFGGANTISFDLSNAGRGLITTISLSFAYSIGMQGSDFKDPISLQNTTSLHYNIYKSNATFNDSPTLNRILNALLSLSRDDYKPQSDITDIVCNFLDNAPLVSNLAHDTYKIFGKYSNLFDMNSERVAKYIIALAHSNLSNMQSGPYGSELFYIPLIITKIDHTLYNRWNEAVLEIYSDIVTFYNNANERLQFYRFIPQGVKEVLKHITTKNEFRDNIITILKSKLKDEITEETTASDFRTMMSIFIELAPYILSADEPVPPPLVPAILLTNQRIQSKELYSLYQRAIESCEECLGLQFAQKFIDKYYETLCSMSETDPIKLNSPFATAAAWKDKHDKMHKLHRPLCVLFESLAPHNIADFAAAVNDMKHPISPDNYAYIRKILKERFSKYENWMKVDPQLMFFFAKQSQNLVDDLWSIPWFDVNENFHLRLFSCLVMPDWYSSLIDVITEQNLKATIASIVSDVDAKNPGFKRWCAYYVNLCQSSSLSDSLWSSSCFSHTPPIPYGDLFSNRNYLYQKNFCEDALGLIKTKYENLSTAVTYHQLANYKAAYSEYINAMTENEDLYSTCLVELRSVASNTTLVKPAIFNEIFKVSNASPKVTLPFLINFSPQNEIKSIVSHQGYNPESFTTYFSQTYLPFLTRSALVEEIYKSLQVLQHRTSQNANMSDLIAPWTVTWMNTLDKLTATVSGIAWRMTIITKMQETAEITPNTPTSTVLTDALHQNYSKYASLLQHSGAVKTALKQLSYGGDTSKFHVTKQSLPRIYYFLKNNHVSKFVTIREQTLILLHDFRSFLAAQKGSPHWLKLIFEVMRCFPSLIEPNSFLQRIASELKSSPNESRDFYIALALNYVRLKPEHIPLFHKVLCQIVLQNPQQKNTQQPQPQQPQHPRFNTDEMKNIWLRWLPMIIKHTEVPPEDFLMALFDKHPMHFLMSVQSLLFHQSTQKLAREIFEKIKAKRRKPLAEFEECFQWISECKEDIERYDVAISAHKALLQCLENNKELENVPQYIVNRVGGSTFADFKRYALENPPFFTVSNKTARHISPNGVRYTAIQLEVNSVSLISRKNEDAMLRLVTTIGEVRYFMLVSPLIYDFTYQEHMFCALIMRMIDHHPANVSRSKFNTFVPYTFLLHPALMVVHHGPVYSLSSAQDIPTLAERLAAMNNVVSDSSPFCKRERKLLFDSNVGLRKWFVDGTEGTFVDFLMMRQAFASSLAFSMSLRIAFGAGLPSIPNIFLSSDRQKVSLPGCFIKRGNYVPVAPLTRSILSIIPKFVLRGSFETSWLSTIDALSKHVTKIRLILDVLKVSESHNEVPNSTVCERIEAMAPSVGEDTEKFSTDFAFDLVSHLIENSTNITDVHASYAWI